MDDMPAGKAEYAMNCNSPPVLRNKVRVGAAGAVGTAAVTVTELETGDKPAVVCAYTVYVAVPGSCVIVDAVVLEAANSTPSL
jgi:hypothetical protein